MLSEKDVTLLRFSLPAAITQCHKDLTNNKMERSLLVSTYVNSTMSKCFSLAHSITMNHILHYNQ